MVKRTSSLQQRLIDWFRSVDRPLPWRTTYNPYHVWISEIMLQQTQMERGVSYFNRWVRRFPNVRSVAEAPEQEILKYWEGLGYYARARNLHAASMILVDRYGGEIPCEYKELLGLPGIGPYTASAISSIACNADIAVIDANVVRVYARLFDIEGNVKQTAVRLQIERLAEQLLPKGRARVFNQALMDFGGLICRPKQPRCAECPVSQECLARLRDTVALRPHQGAGKKVIHIEMATGVLGHEGRVFVQQRKHNDIWGGLWEFPGGKIEENESPAAAVVREFEEETGFAVSVCRKITTVTHYYTRYRVVLHCFGCRLLGDSILPNLVAAIDYRWLLPEEIEDYGFPSGHRKILDYMVDKDQRLLAHPCEGAKL